MREKQMVERARVRARVGGEVARIKTQRDAAVKTQYRANDKSYEDPFCLHYACRFGDVARVEKLVALWAREAEGDPLVVRALAEQRDPDTGRSPLHFAALGGQERVVELLLGCGCDPNGRDPRGMTPLHLAAGWGSTRVLGQLLLRGADKRAPDARGRTPGDLARLNDRRGELAFLERWMDVGLPVADLERLSALPPLPPLQAAAEAAGDAELYLQLRGLEMKERQLGARSSRLAPTLGRLAALLRQRGRGAAALGCLRRQLEHLEAAHAEAARAEAAHEHGAAPVAPGGGGSGGGGGGGDEAAEDSPAEPLAPRLPTPEEAAGLAVALALNNLGELCFALGRTAEA